MIAPASLTRLIAGLLLLISPAVVAQDAGVGPACPAVQIGRACQGDADCGPGGLCFEGVADGYCTVQRDLNCCPPGARRLPGLDLCVAECQFAVDCRARPARQCTAEGICWGCLAPPLDAPIGRPCAGDGDCGGAGCLTAVGPVEIAGGVCTLDLPTYCCPPGTAPGVLGGARFCLPTCRADADCGRPGWGCDYDADGLCRPGAMAPSVDAGRVDGGIVDGGAAPDGGISDAGRRSDAAIVDAGDPGDAAIVDARVIADRGSVVDRGRPDAAAQRDAAPICADAGPPMPDRGPPAQPADDGCGCRATDDGGGGPWVLLSLLALRARRRRRSAP